MRQPNGKTVVVISNSPTHPSGVANQCRQICRALWRSGYDVIKREFNELPPRLAGKSEVDCRVECEKSVAAIFRILKSGETKLEKLSA